MRMIGSLILCLAVLREDATKVNKKKLIRENPIVEAAPVTNDAGGFAALLEQADTDKDGQLSHEEVKAQWAKDFKEEFELETVPEPVLSLLEASDANKNGLVDAGEVDTILDGMGGAMERTGLLEEEEDDDVDTDVMDDDSLLEVDDDSLLEEDEDEADYEDEDETDYEDEDTDSLLEEDETDYDEDTDSLLEEDEDETDYDGEDMAAERFAALLETVDTDKDGRLSLDEVKARWAEDFKQEFALEQIPASALSLLQSSDANNNGFVEQDEVPTIIDHMEAAMEQEGLSEKAQTYFASLLEEVDTDQDGTVSHEEVKARWAKDFKEEFELDQLPASALSLLEASDANKNGLVDRSEVHSVKAGMDAALEQAGLDDASREFGSLLEQTDTNKDGVLSLQEVKDRWTVDFQVLGVPAIPETVLSLLEVADANDNGQIEKDEAAFLTAKMPLAMEMEGLTPESFAEDAEAEAEEPKYFPFDSMLEKSDFETFGDCVNLALTATPKLKDQKDLFNICDQAGQLVGTIVKGLVEAGVATKDMAEVAETPQKTTVTLKLGSKVYGEIATASKVPVVWQLDETVTFEVTGQGAHPWVKVSGLHALPDRIGLTLYDQIFSTAQKCEDSVVQKAIDDGSIIKEMPACLKSEMETAGKYLFYSKGWGKLSKSYMTDTMTKFLDDNKSHKLVKVIKAGWAITMIPAGDWPKIFYAMVTASPITITEFELGANGAAAKSEFYDAAAAGITGYEGSTAGYQAMTLRSKGMAGKSLKDAYDMGVMKVAERAAGSGMALSKMLAFGDPAARKVLVEDLKQTAMGKFDKVVNMFAFCNGAGRQAATVDPPCVNGRFSTTIGRVSWAKALGKASFT